MIDGDYVDIYYRQTHKVKRNKFGVEAYSFLSGPLLVGATSRLQPRNRWIASIQKILST